MARILLLFLESGKVKMQQEIATEVVEVSRKRDQTPPDS
jgi:hypothetical protein